MLFNLQQTSCANCLGKKIKSHVSNCGRISDDFNMRHPPYDGQVYHELACSAFTTLIISLKDSLDSVPLDKELM